MTSSYADRITGVSAGLAMKAPCRLATTANITLSGLQTIDGVTLAADDRVLVKNQSAASQNGIYVASSGTWTRAADFDGSRDVVTGTMVFVTGGRTQGGTWWYVSTSGTLTIGTTSLAFTQASLANVANLLPLSGGSLTGALNEAAVTLASGTTVNIGAATGNVISITGTTTIAGFDTVQAGATRTLRFSGALTLTHNATSLILPGGRDITTAAGDVAVMVSEGSGNWRCADYLRASGAPVHFGTGHVIQRAIASYSTYSTHTTQIPLDNTPPQNNEGDEILTAPITPKFSTSSLRIRVSGIAELSSAGGMAIAVFRDSGADAIATTVESSSSSSFTFTAELEKEVSASSTAATTIKVRVGPVGAYTLRINGGGSARYFGGVAAWTLIVEEIAA